MVNTINVHFDTDIPEDEDTQVVRQRIREIPTYEEGYKYTQSIIDYFAIEGLRAAQTFFRIIPYNGGNLIFPYSLSTSHHAAYPIPLL